MKYIENNSGNTAYLPMEYCRAGSLVDFIHNYYDIYKRPIDSITIKTICEHIRQSQKDLHQTGFIHRDIKLENFVVWQTEDKSQFKVKCCDFGESRSFTEKMITLSEESNPTYKSFEKQNGQIYTTKSDLYSIGVCYYHVLCQRPYQPKLENGRLVVDFPTEVNRDDTFDSLKNLILNLIQGEQGIEWEQYFAWEF